MHDDGDDENNDLLMVRTLETLWNHMMNDDEREHEQLMMNDEYPEALT